MYSKGNPTSYDGYNYSWVNGRQLQSISNGINTYSYKYNDSGIRTEKNVNGTISKYFLEGSDIIYEQRGNDVIYYTYDMSGVSGFEYKGNTYHYVKNLQGDVIGILDSNYNQVVSYEYDAWGNILNQSLGNNIFNKNNVIQGVYGYGATSGTPIFSSSTTRLTLAPSSAIQFEGSTGISMNTDGLYMAIAFLDANKNCLGDTGWQTGTFTAVSPANTKYIAFNIRKADNSNIVPSDMDNLNIWVSEDIDGTSGIGMINPFRYRSYYYDAETSLYYLNSRYYSPEFGRFLNADNIIGTNNSILGYNLYAYVLNNPINLKDPGGKSAIFATMNGIIAKYMSIGIKAAINAKKADVASKSANSNVCPTPPKQAGRLPDLPYRGLPNSYNKTPDGRKERWYDDKGLPIRDRHNTDHGNPKLHPDVPHDHDWLDDENGNRSPGDGHKPELPSIDYGAAVGTAVIVYGGYQIIKWGIAIWTAPVTGGASLVLAGATP